jgi:pyruvate dehydrogenase E2 component (dihydrolipoamide acetyltransferase)
MPKITMPRLSDSMEEGTIISWLVEDGQPVLTGEDLVEIETDKAAVTHTAEAEGVLRILAPPGTKCAVGTVIARLESADTGGGHPQPARPIPLPSETPIPSEAPLILTPASNAATRLDDGTTSLATPLARRAAAIHGVQLETVSPTGPRGRITHSDVLAAAGIRMPIAPLLQTQSLSPTQRLHATPASAPTALDTTRGETTLVPRTRVQQVIAERMAQANDTIPAFQVQTEVNFADVVALRQSMKDVLSESRVPSLNDFVIKAVALALREFPAANASYDDAGFEFHRRINVGVAIAAEGALLVPTVFDADTKSLGAIATETRLLAERVRSATVSPAELSGGTFTVSNLGMYGMTAITPVINPPQAAILGVGAAREVLARTEEGTILERPMVTLTLSCDHRILYGAEAARFLSSIQTLLEIPLRLVL